MRGWRLSPTGLLCKWPTDQLTTYSGLEDITVATAWLVWLQNTFVISICIGTDGESRDMGTMVATDISRLNLSTSLL